MRGEQRPGRSALDAIGGVRAVLRGAFELPARPFDRLKRARIEPQRAQAADRSGCPPLRESARTARANRRARGPALARAARAEIGARITPNVTLAEQRRDQAGVFGDAARLALGDDARLPRMKRKGEQALADAGELSGSIDRAEVGQELLGCPEMRGGGAAEPCRVRRATRRPRRAAKAAPRRGRRARSRANRARLATRSRPACRAAAPCPRAYGPPRSGALDRRGAADLLSAEQRQARSTASARPPAQAPSRPRR